MHFNAVNGRRFIRKESVTFLNSLLLPKSSTFKTWFWENDCKHKCVITLDDWHAKKNTRALAKRATKEIEREIE